MLRIHARKFGEVRSHDSRDRQTDRHTEVHYIYDRPLAIYQAVQEFKNPLKSLQIVVLSKAAFTPHPAPRVVFAPNGANAAFTAARNPEQNSAQRCATYGVNVT